MTERISQDEPVSADYLPDAEVVELCQDLIKIDTDGHEYEVFKGAEQVIAKYRPRVIFEIGLYVMEEKMIDFDFYFNYFQKLNYQLIDTKSGATIRLGNYRKHIPKKGSTDLIAIPLK